MFYIVCIFSICLVIRFFQHMDEHAGDTAESLCWCVGGSVAMFVAHSFCQSILLLDFFVTCYIFYKAGDQIS